jgi:hypothetical protein
MRSWGMTTFVALVTAILLGLTASSAIAATPIAVTETTDAPLESGASTCESTDTAKGCTLRAAVELADSEGAVTIDVPEGTYQETATEPTLAVEDDAEVTILGAGAEKTIIEGDATASVLEVQPDSSLTLDGVTVTNGEEEEGAGVYVAPFAFLTVENSTITENLATKYGGGIFGDFLSHIVVKGSTIVENLADEDGGGIATEEGSYVSVQESQITKNRAGESGGGLISGRHSVVTVDKSTVAKNEAEYEGGGVAAYMSEEFCAGDRSQRSAGDRRATDGDETEPELTVDQSTVEHNSAEYGGGIFTYEEDGECEVASSKTAVKPQTALFDEPSLSIDQSTIASNRAEERDEEGGYGGGIYEEGFFEDPITNSTIADNFATNDGGGAAIAHGSSVALVSDTVFDNTVQPEEIDIQGRSARRAIHRDVVEGVAGPGSNLATEDEDAYVGLRNTIVAEPSASVENCEGNFESLVEKDGYNLDYPSKALSEGTLDSCGMSSEEQDLVGVAPGLDEAAGLAGNGGPAQTIALLSSSPAIGFVPVTGDCDESENGPASVDQRGEPRPGIPGKGCDIGAYEYQEAPPVATPTKEEPKQQAAASVLSIKVVSPAQCASKRDITIHIQNVKQLGVVSAVVSIDGQHKRTLHGRHLSTGIDLVGLPKGTFTIEIVARTRGGHTLKGERVYHTCHTKLPGHSYLKL